MMSTARLGLLCSVSRILTVSTVVGAAFLRLPPEQFLEFSRFHVALSFASFIECLAVIERTRLYQAAQAQDQRLAFVVFFRRAGWALMAGGAALLAWHASLAALVIGAAIACLSVPEAASLRENAHAGNVIELKALGSTLLVAAAAALHGGFSLTWSLALLALASSAPRLALSMTLRVHTPPAVLRPTFTAVRSNLRSVLSFMGLQAVLPMLVAAPTYGLPRLVPARDASWLLLALRASGAVSSALSRVMVRLWIGIADANAGPRLPTGRMSGLLLAGWCLLALAIAALPLPWAVACFCAYLAVTTVCVAWLSTHLNARGAFLLQIVPYALFWAGGTAVVWGVGQVGWAAPSASAFMLLHAAFAILATVLFALLCRLHDRTPGPQ
jgi:hypothetical protein